MQDNDLSRKHAYIMLTPLKPHFYIVKLGFTGVYIVFLISAQKHRLWACVTGGSNEYPQSMFLNRNMKNIRIFIENFHFLVVEFSVYLNRLVFVMKTYKLPSTGNKVTPTIRTGEEVK